MKKVKVIIFDVDGTLYEPIDELANELHDYWMEQLSYFLKINQRDAEKRFSAIKKKYNSSTLTLASLGMGEPYDIIKKAEHHMRPYHKKLVKKDRDLIKIFKELKKHYTLTTMRNGTKAGTRFMLGLLGFSKRRDKRDTGFGPFDIILPTVELGPTKPDPIPYKNALHKLQIDPEEILFVGDREKTDLEQAKLHGMRTVLVDWGRGLKYDKSIVDSTIDTIYDLKQLIP